MSSKGRPADVRHDEAASAVLGEFVSSLQSAQERISWLRALVDSAGSEDELVAMMTTADRIRDDIIATASAEAEWPTDEGEPRVIIDARSSESADEQYRWHADLTSRIGELRDLLVNLADVEIVPGAETDAPDPKEPWGSGDVFGEIYR